ncbi:MocR-like pyridoxine biosynthesis transcription factor PdxR [Chachezhania sediminis]|uniref:MocR-like pyridoxine biosynthesis transcription factor PdxR n=1 Tax=Chachezhania sediminis TaxID=2599291 RepID=UPI00131E6DB3|nr:aminotransferase class I/II-fold pyridoxal phosphate-dependent enzyme [Chachezhania sediminis]
MTRGCAEIRFFACGPEILAVFRVGDRHPGNQELSQWTGLPKPTVSCPTFMPTELGYLVVNLRFNTCEIGGKTLAPGHRALAAVDMRQVARDHMADIAVRTSLCAGPAVRDERGIYGLNVGGPAHQVAEQDLQDVVGPMMADTIRTLEERLGVAPCSPLARDRPRADGGQMVGHRFHLPESSPLSLRDQICDVIGRAIADGALGPGQALPSCREMSGQLNVSRSTVFQAYASLVDRGLIRAKDRSGYVVDPEAAPLNLPPDDAAVEPTPIPALEGRPLPSQLPRIDTPADWSRYKYPFIYSQIDTGTFPIQAWRECMRLALNANRLPLWAGDGGGADSALLVDQLRQRLLGYRGIRAAPDEILITAGAQNGLYILGTLFGGPGAQVAIEDPGYPEARNAFALTGHRLCPVPLDSDGMQVDRIPDGCRMVYVTPSHQFPTTVTMSLERRRALIDLAVKRQMIVIEDDYESERNFLKDALPPIRVLSPSGTAVYVGSLSKALSPGLRLGYIVADRRIIREATAIRRAMMRNPAALLQDAMAHFLALGHQDAHLRGLHRRFRRRWETMRAALATHMPDLPMGAGQGGSSFWIEGPDRLDTDRLQARLRARGVLIDKGTPFFIDPARARGRFRLSFGALRSNDIDPGIALVAGELRALI